MEGLIEKIALMPNYDIYLIYLRMLLWTSIDDNSFRFHWPYPERYSLFVERSEDTFTLPARSLAKS